MCTGIADLGRYKSVGCWRATFVIFTASFTLLKIYKVAPQAEIFMHLADSPFCELREMGTAGMFSQWTMTRALRGSVLEWHSNQKPTSCNLVMSNLRSSLLRPLQLKRLWCLVLATVDGGDSHMSHD